ncbi:MAG TPA: hypothetical protein VLH10_05405, partial [Yinghuangia sp.]|nr:hypothetical protein [Yinghuangia sp.]
GAAVAVTTTLLVLHSPTGAGSEARQETPAVAYAPVLPGFATPEATPTFAAVPERGSTSSPPAPDGSATPLTAPLPDPNTPAQTASSLPPPPAPPPVKPAAHTTSGRTGNGTPGGDASGGRGAKPSTPPAPKPAAPADPAPPAAKPAAAPPPPVVPAGCGGAGWGAITNLGSGMKIGIDTASPGVGSRLVTGGRTEYGWVVVPTVLWQTIRSCGADGLAVTPGTSPSGVSLGNAAYAAGMLTISAAPTPGAALITHMAGQQCLTDNGPGRQLTFARCTPGDTAQQWYLP